MTIAVILAGGKGMRMGGPQSPVPKPLTPVGGRPVIRHLMENLAGQGISRFVVALGHRGDEIRACFAGDPPGWPVDLVDTGSETATAGRLARAAHLLDGQTFVLTYCDGLHDIDVQGLLRVHRQAGRKATMVSVEPRCRFGIVDLDGDRVVAMREKPKMDGLWINAGLFALEPAVVGMIDGDAASWETDTLPKLVAEGEVGVMRHKGFWQCMDTPSDAALLERLWQAGEAPWTTRGEG